MSQPKAVGSDPGGLRGAESAPRPAARVPRMGVAVEVDFDQMQTMIDVLLAALSDLHGAGASLSRESQLLLGGWDGEAADAYAGRHASWQTAHGYTADELTSAITSLKRALARYQDAEATILDLVV